MQEKHQKVHQEVDRQLLFFGHFQVTNCLLLIPDNRLLLNPMPMKDIEMKSLMT